MPEEQMKKTAMPSSIGLLILGIIVIAANLRAPLTSVGPLVSLIKDEVHISNTLAGMITTLPLLVLPYYRLSYPSSDADMDLSERF